MDLNAARILADSLIAAHIPTKGFHFDFDNAENRLGLCNFKLKRISMGRVYVLSEDEAGVTQTLLHEIGHAIAGPAAKHGPRWYAAARSIGYTGKSHGSNPAATAKRDAAIEYALSQVEAVKGRTTGQFLPGERVKAPTFTGIFVTARVKNASVWDEARQKTWAVPLTALSRVGGLSARDEQVAVARAAGMSVAGITSGPLRIGETVRTKPGFKQVTAVVFGIEKPAGRSRTRRIKMVLPDGVCYTTNESNLVRVATGTAAVGAGTPGPVPVVFTRGTPVTINYPKSKWHGSSGVIEKVNAKTIKVTLASGETLVATKSLLIAA